MIRDPRRNNAYPEPGAWVWSQTQGMPHILPPDPLPKGKITAEEVLEFIAYEGLGSCLRCIDPKKLTDKRLTNLWKKAQLASTEILAYLETVEIKAIQKPTKRKTITIIVGETDDEEFDL
jgi:hypothetical protein